MNTISLFVARPRVLCFIALLVLSLGLGSLSTTPVLAQATTTTIRVAPSGNDVNGCGSTATPCQSISYAVNQAASGTTILVAAGTYTYKAATDTCSFLVSRAVVCFVDKNLSILGGYSASNWGSADPVANRTVIDGQNTRRGVAVIAYNTTAHLRMEGFTIQNGVAQGAASGDDFTTFAFGGGIWAQNSTLALRDMILTGNKAIGGNTSIKYGGGGSGGGVAITSSKNGAQSVLERVTFESNEALGGSGPERGGVAIGGGLFTYQSVTSADFVTFTNNRARAGHSTGIGTSAGLRADALGGGVGFQLGSTATIKHMTATGNQAVGGNAATDGGGAFGGGLHAEETLLTLTDSMLQQNATIGGNAASGGVGFSGGFETFNSTATIDRVQVIGNTATSGASTTGGNAGSPSGGGAYIADFTNTHRINITNSVFADNRIVVGTPGKGIGGGGAGMVLQGMKATVTHSTFAQNVLGPSLIVGQAVLVQGTAGASGTPGVADLDYCIFADHTGTAGASTVHVSAGSTANLKRGLFAGNTKNTNADAQPLAAGTFTGLNTMVSAPSADFVAPNAPTYNYHITGTSPAKDQASGSTTTTDIDGQPRPVGPAADIGADEFILLDRRLYVPAVNK